MKAKPIWIAACHVCTISHHLTPFRFLFCVMNAVQALRLLRDMRQRGVEPDLVAYTAVMDCCGKTGQVGKNGDKWCFRVN